MSEEFTLESINPFAREILFVRAKRLSEKGWGDVEDLARELLEKMQKAVTFLNRAKAIDAVENQFKPVAEEFYSLASSYFVSAGYLEGAARIIKRKDKVSALNLYDMAIEDYKELGFPDMAYKVSLEKESLETGSL